ncbi:aldehyde dehydrogenase family protein [Cryptosporangium minutisporangium]|uniref:Aldehyde dehydrogenase n=1 Tax=Cryptosporangium minutisporangium TaxID=113569 RepID=A0ABP6T5N8_9ACTN
MAPSRPDLDDTGLDDPDPVPDRFATPTTLSRRSPATGEIVGEYPIAGETEVGAAVERARTAATWWAALPADRRRTHLLAWKRGLARGADDLAALIRAETGKPLTDAGLEVMLAVEHLDWAARNAHRVLRPRTVRSGVLAANQRGVLGYRPLGVVGVIGPWNYPVYTPLGSVSYALAAGNAVVFKPSEYTPGVAQWLAERFVAAVGEPVLQVVTGDGGTGAALCRAGVDKIAFTGSTATAKTVMAACAETLTPLVVEAGGKDAMIVAADADVDAAAAAAVFGGMGNAGQTCAGVERVYVERPVYSAFVDAVRARAEALRPGAGDEADYGPLTMPRQADVIAGHVADALARGGRPVVGGADAVRPPYVDPVVLTDVPEDSSAVTEETFGPVLVINPVDDLDDAVRRANASTLGLAGSVFTKDTRRGAAIAARLRTGAASVNSVLGFAAIPALPFGGVGDSGFGRIHGADGLREFSRAGALTVQRFPAPLDLMRFDRSPRAVAMAWRVFRLRHAR